MTDKHTLVERLEAIEHCYAVPVCRLAATRITALEAEKAELLSVMLDLFENPAFQVAIGGNPAMVEALMDRARAAITKATPEDRS
jgi:hypothetical protein